MLCTFGLFTTKICSSKGQYRTAESVWRGVELLLELIIASREMIVSRSYFSIVDLKTLPDKFTKLFDFPFFPRTFGLSSVLCFAPFCVARRGRCLPGKAEPGSCSLSLCPLCFRNALPLPCDKNVTFISSELPEMYLRRKVLVCILVHH